MNVTTGRPPRHQRSLAALSMLALAGLAGVAHAAEFDEALKAPMMKSAADFRTQAQGLATRYGEVRAATPAQLVTNASLARQQFDLSWQLERAINERRPPDELETMGFVNLGNGGYSIDTRKYPEWRFLGESIARMFSSNLREGVFDELLQRGFRAEDIAALRQYLATHDVDQATRTAIVPIALGFQRVVQKFDKAGRPVPDALVVSYWYQSTRASMDASRAWSAGLLETLDTQRVRILHSYLSELASSRSLFPENVGEGIQGTLASVRAPDFEKRLTMPKGVEP